MKRHCWKHLVVGLVAVGLTPLFGTVAAAQTEPSSAIQDGVVVVGSIVRDKVGPRTCQEPPCQPPPSPNETGSCTVVLHPPKLETLDPEVWAMSDASCYLLNGDPFPMDHISVDTEIRSESGLYHSELFESGGTHYEGGVVVVPYRCENYQSSAEAIFDLPFGWHWAPGSDGHISKSSGWKYICRTQA